jgi:hypothetical protein
MNIEKVDLNENLPIPTDQPTSLTTQPSDTTEPANPKSRQFPIVLVLTVLLGLMLVGDCYLFLTNRSLRRQSGQEKIQTSSPNNVPPIVTPSVPLEAAPSVAYLPPLYPEIQWESTKSADLAFYPDANDPETKYTIDDTGIRVRVMVRVKGFVNEAFHLKSYPRDFVGYYLSLIDSGWKETHFATDVSDHGEDDCLVNADHNQYICIHVRKQIEPPQDLWNASIEYN